MPVTQISALPTPPSRADDPAGFSAKADAFLGALPVFRTEANTLATDVETLKSNTQAIKDAAVTDTTAIKAAAEASLAAIAATAVSDTTALKDQAAASATAAAGSQAAAAASSTAAAGSAATAATHATNAGTYKDQAQTAAAAAAAAAGLPSLAGNAGKMLLVAAGEAGVEWGLAMTRLPILQANAGWTPASALENLIAGTYSTGLAGSSSYLLAGESLFVCVGITAQSSVATSADGQTWTLRTMPSSAVWSITYNGTDFLAIVGGATTAAQSADGITWSSATALPGAASGQAPAYVGGLWLVRGSGTTYYTSADGVAWTSRALPAAPSDGYIYASNNVAWFYSSATQAYSSTDGINWTLRSHGGITQPGVDFDGKLIGLIGFSIYESSDGGVTWTDTGIDSPLAGAQTYATLNGVRLIGNNAANGGAWVYDNGSWVQRYLSLLGLASTGRSMVGARNTYAALLGSKLALVNGVSVSLVLLGAPGATGLFTR